MSIRRVHPSRGRPAPRGVGERAAAGAAPIRQARRRGGVTLLELLVVLAVLAVIAGVTGAAFGRRLPPATWQDGVAESVARARAAALARGADVPFAVSTPGNGTVRGVARPDGSVVAAPELAVRRLTGRVRPAYGDTTRGGRAGAP